MEESKAALYEAPFEYVRKHVKPLRDQNRDSQRKKYWWRHGRAGTNLRSALSGKRRQLVTPCISKFRLFSWTSPETVATNACIVFARDDDYFFGVLQSRAHEVWGLQQGTQLENRPRYTATSSFETFPFPHPTEAQKEEIAELAKELNIWRQAWLNPSSDGVGLRKTDLNRRTLTNLYNESPTWLTNAHAKLDAAVFAAYGWPEPPSKLSDQDIIARLLVLNLTREPV